MISSYRKQKEENKERGSQKVDGKILERDERVLLVMRKKERILKSIKGQSKETLEIKLRGIFGRGKDRVKKEKGWNLFKEKVEAIGEGTSDVCNEIISLIPERVGIEANKEDVTERHSFKEVSLASMDGME